MLNSKLIWFLIWIPPKVGGLKEQNPHKLSIKNWQIVENDTFSDYVPDMTNTVRIVVSEFSSDFRPSVYTSIRLYYHSVFYVKLLRPGIIIVVVIIILLVTTDRSRPLASRLSILKCIFKKSLFSQWVHKPKYLKNAIKTKSMFGFCSTIFGIQIIRKRKKDKIKWKRDWNFYKLCCLFFQTGHVKNKLTVEHQLQRWKYMRSFRNVSRQRQTRWMHPEKHNIINKMWKTTQNEHELMKRVYYRNKLIWFSQIHVSVARYMLVSTEEIDVLFSATQLPFFLTKCCAWTSRTFSSWPKRGAFSSLLSNS